MGVYDTVLVPCPTCEVTAEFQSKSGRCLLETYTLEDAPDDVLLDVNRHAPMHCRQCGTRFAVALSGQRPRRTLTAHAVIWKETEQRARGAEPGSMSIEEMAHGNRCHPDYEYETTTNQRKSGDSPKPNGDGWEPNLFVTGDGRSWERFEYHENNYWMRRRPNRRNDDEGAPP